MARPLIFHSFYTVFCTIILHLTSSINVWNLDTTFVTFLLHLPLFSCRYQKDTIIISNSFMLVWKSARTERGTSSLGLKHKHRLWRLMPFWLTARTEECALEKRLIAPKRRFALKNGKGVVLPNRFSSLRERRGASSTKLNYAVKWSLAHQ